MVALAKIIYKQTKKIFPLFFYLAVIILIAHKI